MHYAVIATCCALASRACPACRPNTGNQADGGSDNSTCGALSQGRTQSMTRRKEPCCQQRACAERLQTMCSSICSQQYCSHCSRAHICKRMIESVRRTFTKLGRKTLRSGKDRGQYLSEHVQSDNGQSQELDSTNVSRSSTLRSELDSKCRVTNDSSVTAEIDSKAFTELATDSGRPAELDSGHISPAGLVKMPIAQADAGPLSRCPEGPRIAPKNYASYSSMCVSPCSATDLNSQTSRYSVVSEMEDTAPRFNSSQSTSYSKQSTFTEPWSSQAISTCSSPPNTASQVIVYPNHEYKTTPYSGGGEISHGKPHLSDKELCSSPSSYLPDTTSGDHDVFSSTGIWSVSSFGDSALPEQSQTTNNACTNYTSRSASGQSSILLPSAQHSDKEVVPEGAYRLYEQSSTKSHDPHIVLCHCHNRPMLPTLFWPLPQHIFDGTTGQINALRSTSKTRLHLDMKDIFELMVRISYERIGSLDHDMQQSIAPAFQQRPVLESSLAALCSIVGGAEPCAIGELVSLLYLVFTVLMLSVDELDRDRYTEALFLDATSWIETLKSDYDQRAFETLLDIVWLPAALANFGSRECHWSVSTLKSACPWTRPIAPIDESISRNLLDNEKAGAYGMRTGVVARMCQNYIECTMFAASHIYTANVESRSL